MNRNRSRRARWLPAWIVCLLIVMAGGTIWLRLSIVRTAYAIHETNQMIRELKQAREQMQLKVTALRSPRKLEILARTRFGLAPPRSEQIIHFKPSSAVEAALEP